MTAWPTSKCKAGDHRWQDGQCAICGMPQSPLDRAETLRVEAAVTNTIWAIADDLRGNGFSEAAARVEATFLEPDVTPAVEQA